MNNMNVMNRRMFQMPSAPRPMQEGGMATMMPPEMMGPPPMAPEPAMMPAPAPAPAMMPPPAPAPALGPQDISDEGVATLLAEQGIDPAQMQGLLESAAVGFGNLDEVEDYEQAMNAIRGDQASVGQRRDELAELVGSQDANKTPESVLTLVQPVMLLAEIDQGIGGLAQGAMTEPVTGDMAGGIMSTVGMGGAEEASAPVNFNQGGAVQRFAPGNSRVVNDPNRIRKLFTEQQQLYGDLITPTLTAEDLAEDRRLTEAQMLFDIAQAGLQLAQPGRPGENFLGSVARAASDSQVFDKIGARAAEQRKLERAARAEKQAIDLAALKSAQDIYSTDRALEAKLMQDALDFEPGIFNVFDVDAAGTRTPRLSNIKLTPQQLNAIGADPLLYAEKAPTPSEAGAQSNYINLQSRDGKPHVVNGVNVPSTVLVDVTKPIFRDLTGVDGAYVRAGVFDPSDAGVETVTMRHPLGQTFTVGKRNSDYFTLNANDDNDKKTIALLSENGFVQTNDLSWADNNLRDQITGWNVVVPNVGFTDLNESEKFTAMTSDARLMGAFADGSLDTMTNAFNSSLSGNTIANTLISRIQDEHRVKREWSDSSNTFTNVTRPPTDTVSQAIARRAEKNLPVPVLDTTKKPAKKEPIPEDLFLSEGALVFPGNLDLRKSLGARGGFNRMTNFVGGQVENIANGMNLSKAEEWGFNAQDENIVAANDALTKLADDVKRVVRDEISGKAFASDLAGIENQVAAFRPSAANNPRAALSSMKSTRLGLLNGLRRYNEEVINNVSSQKDIAHAEKSRDELESFIGQLTAAIQLLERDLGVAAETPAEVLNNLDRGPLRTLTFK